jgi:hypothetical protein
MRTIFLLPVLVLFVSMVNGQELVVDSKGEPVFQFYSVEMPDYYSIEGRRCPLLIFLKRMQRNQIRECFYSYQS